MVGGIAEECGEERPVIAGRPFTHITTEDREQRHRGSHARITSGRTNLTLDSASELSHTLRAYLDHIPFGYFILMCLESGQDFAPLPLRYPKVVEAAREFCHHLVKLLG